MNKADAIKYGFTHQGKIFGINVWMTDDDIPSIAAKSWFLDDLVFVLVKMQQWFCAAFMINSVFKIKNIRNI